jgi:hypothetical protein
MHELTTGKHGLTRLTMAQTWGEATTFPLIVFFVTSHRANTQMSFCPKNPKILKIGIPATLEAHNFVCRPLIEKRFKENL